jgi:glycosyltransferase involved in cell wall biosynthesis
VRIAILVAGLPPERVGGAEMQAAHAARSLGARHDVTVWTRTRTVPPELVSARRCRVITRTAPPVPGLRFLLDLVTTITRFFVNRRRIDVILAYQTAIDGLIAVLAGRALGIPAVVSVRGEVEYRIERSRQSRWLSPFVFRHADRLLVQSPIMARELLDVFARRPGHPTASPLAAKLRVVPNGIGLDGETETVAERRSVLFVGRLTAGKGVDVLIDAMRACPNEALVVVGDGPERAQLEARTRGLDWVTFAGAASHDEVERHLAAAKMLVLPSFHEGQPNALMEAMARGVPVVATAVGGIPDLVRDGETGILVRPGDVAGTAAAIRRLSGSPALRTSLAQRARQEMAQYEWSSVMRTLERELVEVVASAGGPAAGP